MAAEHKMLNTCRSSLNLPEKAVSCLTHDWTPLNALAVSQSARGLPGACCDSMYSRWQTVSIRRSCACNGGADNCSGAVNPLTGVMACCRHCSCKTLTVQGVQERHSVSLQFLRCKPHVCHALD